MQMVLVYHSCFSRVPGYFYASKRWFAFCFLVLFVLVLLLLLSFSYSFPFGWLFFCSLSPLLVFVGLFSFFSLFCVLHDSLSLSLLSLSFRFLSFLVFFCRRSCFSTICKWVFSSTTSCQVIIPSIPAYFLYLRFGVYNRLWYLSNAPFIPRELGFIHSFHACLLTFRLCTSISLLCFILFFF